ncbi:hypothetical protein LTR85_009559 [Meristemomyces frigidus]|nr:hypothetical protein LTR85_009559 [Meristemomyces frigidus]
MDYSKKKNDELVSLLKERGLPHTGKKADFVKRLEDYDTAQPSGTTAATPAPKPALEDEIDWDDEPATEIAKTATTEPAADAIAAGGIGEVKNPVDVPNQTLVEDPAQTDDLTVAAAPATTETAPVADGEAPADAKPAEKEKSPEKDFSQGIADRAIDEEIEKRKARARRFGLPEDSDEVKLLERAKRFGVTDTSAVPGLLNQALSQGRKRDRAEGAAAGEAGGEDGGVRKRNKGGRGGRNGRGGRPGMSGRQGSDRPRGDRPAPAKKEGGNGASWMNDTDRQKAEARKARFAAPS